MQRKKLLLADISLFTIAVAWGYTFVLTKDLLNEMGPFFFMGTRFLIAALLLVPFCWKQLRQAKQLVVRSGMVCGVLLWAAFTMQIVGISLTTPGKAGVITGTMVIIVPFLYFLSTRQRVQFGPVFGSLCAFFGLCLLSWDGSWSGLNSGDWIVLGGAVCFALHMVSVDRTLQQSEPIDPLGFVMLQLLVVGIINTGVALVIEQVPQSLSPYGWFAYLFDLIVGTLLAYVVQIIAQKYSPPTHVGLLFSFEPVFAYIFSWLLYEEPVTASTVGGIALIIIGIFATKLGELVFSFKKQKTMVE